VTAQMSKQDAQFFKKELKNIKNNSLDFEDGLEKFEHCVRDLSLFIQAS
jgi:hypothetical protein